MHEPVRRHLENLLAGENGEPEQSQLSIHLQSCSECSLEYASMKAQSNLFQTLRVPEELEPMAGFYARVMQTIEEHTNCSIWSGFIYSPVRTRLAYMSLSLAILLGVYVVAQERSEYEPGQRMIAQQIYQNAPVFAGNAAEQRDAVLINFASQ